MIALLIGFDRAVAADGRIGVTREARDGVVVRATVVVGRVAADFLLVEVLAVGVTHVHPIDWVAGVRALQDRQRWERAGWREGL